MQIQSFSQAGSIRGINQDCLLIDHRIRLTLIADGHGPGGKAAAKLAAFKVCQRLDEIAPVTGGNETLSRLREACELAINESKEQFGTQNRSDITAVWVNRGSAAIVATGTCRALVAQPGEVDWLEQCEAELPVVAGMSILLVSEGAAAALSSQQLQPALNDMLAQHTEESFTAFAQQTASVYDGDDCSAIVLRLETSDATAGIPHEIELFEHYNREYSCKLWLPLSLAGAIVVGALAAVRKLKPLFDRLKV